MTPARGLWYPTSMRRSPLPFAVALAAIVFTLSESPAGATDFFVFPVKVSLPVVMVVPGSSVVVKRTFKEKDVVNLALGRPLDAKIDKKREILAVMGGREELDLPKARIIVYDPTQNGLAQVTTIVAEPIVIDRQTAFLVKGKQGHGLITGRTLETTLGDPTHNAIHTAIGWASGAGKKNGTSGSASGIVAGRASVTLTEAGQTTTLAGFIVNGKVKATAKPLGMFSDGVFVGCGDGIIQPGLGEECEFSDDGACPGKCSACHCEVCGNARVDPGEICDGADDSACQALTPPVPCQADCKSCAVCGDGIISPTEDCDIATGGQPCPGRCLFPECRCGCAADDPGGCPEDLCCSNARCWAVKTGFPSDDPNSPLGASSCSGGGVLASGLCGNLLPPGSTCPDTDADANTFFSCHACDGKFVHKLCTLGAQSCVLDEIGPLP